MFLIFSFLLFIFSSPFAISSEINNCLNNIIKYEKKFKSFSYSKNRSCEITVYQDAITGVDFLEDERITALWKNTKDGIVMTGELGTFTLPMLDALQDLEHKKIFIMKEVPGSYDDEALLDAIYLIRELKYETHVPKKGSISSGGTDFFIGGIKRTVSQQVKIGVHSWATTDGKTARDYPKDSPRHQPYIKLYKDMGISNDFYWFTIEQAPARKMYWLTTTEIEKYLIKK